MKTNKKSVKKILGSSGIILLATTVLAVSSGYQAHADSSSAPDTENVEIHKYAFDTKENAGDVKNTGDDLNDLFKNGEPLKNITFSRTDVTEIYYALTDLKDDKGKAIFTIDDNTNEVSEYLQKVFTVLTDVDITDVKAVSVALAGMKDANSDANATIEKIGLTNAMVSITTGEDGTVIDKAVPTKSNSKNAVYVYLETQTDGSVETSSPLIVGLPVAKTKNSEATNVDSNGFLTTVNIYPKNILLKTNLEFTKKGVDSTVTNEDNAKPLADAQFILEGKGGYYKESSAAGIVTFTPNIDEAHIFTSDSSGLVKTDDLALPSDNYSFKELTAGSKEGSETLATQNTVTVETKDDKETSNNYANDYYAGAKSLVEFSVEDGKVTEYKTTDIGDSVSITQKDGDGVISADEAKDISVFNYQTPTPKKEVTSGSQKYTDSNGDDHNSVDEDGAITFSISQEIPLDIASYDKFDLYDEPSKGLVYVDGTTDLSGNKIPTIAQIKVGDIILDASEYTIISGKTTDYTAAGFTVDFKKALTDGKLTAGSTITFNYKMELTSEAVINTAVFNKLTFNNTHTPNGNIPDEPTPPTTRTNVVTYGAKFVKKDANTGETLKDAQFLVLNENKSEYRTMTTVDGTVVYGWKKYSDLTTAQADKDALILTSDDKGEFEVVGLKANSSSSSSYYLQELKAPTGYALADDAFEFKANDETYDISAPQANILNKQKGVLPHTGGAGIIAFIVVGIAIIIGVAFYFKRRHTEVEA